MAELANNNESTDFIQGLALPVLMLAMLAMMLVLSLIHI